MASKKHARSDSQTHDDYIEVENMLKKPSTKRAKQIDADPPYARLCERIDQTRSRDVEPRNVLHWFRTCSIADL
ncbi:hypothetical protein LTR85_010967 [Meristemomyces frigidus]|nr:hypothetical protein LTR85_010967 [Meristemomyces frigidus]